jgi:hypothetical protein
MILVPHNSRAGLFSHINLVVTLIENRGAADFHVDWTNGMLYCEPDRGNLFEYLFDQLASESPNDTRSCAWPHRKYTGNAAAALYRGKPDWRRRLNASWNRLRVSRDIIADVDSFCQNWCEATAAVHIRNHWIGTECVGGVSPSLEDYQAKLHDVDGKIFLATDNNEAVDFFRACFSDRLLVREIPRGRDMQSEYHLTARQGFLDARNTLIDALIMARCQYLIHSVSNIATAVLYINPEMYHTFVTARR